MGKNKQLRKQIAGDSRQIARHEAKIVAELRKSNPDKGMVAHWRKEIRGWRGVIERRSKKLPNRRKS